MWASSTFLHCGQIDRVKPKNALSRSRFAGTGCMAAILLRHGAAVEHDHRTVEVTVARGCEPRDELAAFRGLPDPAERARVDVALLVVLGDRRAQAALEDAGGDAVRQHAVAAELVREAV